MSTRRERAKAQSGKSGRNHNDGMTYFERYQKEAILSESVETFWPHLNAEGLPWLLTGGSKALPDTFEGLREQLVQERVTEINEVVFSITPYVTMPYETTREHAEQIVDTMMGVWPPKRILCCATAKQLETLEAKYGPLPAHYYDVELPLAA